MAADRGDENPYVGPRPFERTASDRARFFGRDREVEEIVSLIFSHSLLLVYAQSGAGKTSLFNTAVTDALTGKDFEVLPQTRVRGVLPEDVDPSTIANLYVFHALLNLDPEADPRALAELSLREYLRRDPAADSQPRALVFDQLEEVFTFEKIFELFPESWQEQQEGFFRQVSSALADDPLLRVVFVIRKEYLAELDRAARLLPERLQTRLQLEPLSRDAGLDAVTLPLQQTKRSFAPGAAEALVEKLLTMRVDLGGGVTKEIQGRFVEPVQLQLVCRTLWQDLPPDIAVITEEHLKAFGDVDHVLGQFYESAVRDAVGSGRGARRRETRLRKLIDEDFITSVGTRGTAYRTSEWGDLDDAVGELEKRQLVRAEWRAGTHWYELTHDRLIEPIHRSNERFWAARSRKRLVQLAVAVVALAAIAGLSLVSAALLRPGSPAPPEDALRQRILAGALAGVRNEPKIHYSQRRGPHGFGFPKRSQVPVPPTQADSSSFVTWCYWQAGAPDPNGRHYDGSAYTGFLLQHMRHISRGAVKPGDLVVFGPPPGRHVALVYGTGRDPWLVSHGSEQGPRMVRFSVEERGFVSTFGNGTVTWLTLPQGGA
jgi:hypothetical protein